MSMGDCDTEVGPFTPVRDTEEMALMVDLAKLAAEAGVTNDLGFRAFMREVVGDHDAEQASDAWVLAGGVRMAGGKATPASKERPTTVDPNMRYELDRQTLGSTKEGQETEARATRLTLDEINNPKDTPAETISLGLGDAGDNFGERTVFNWDWADATGRLIRDTYQTPGSKARDPKTKENLAYYGGYIYERLSRMNNKRPKIDTWAAYMKASTGHDIAPQDLLDAWESMRQTAWKTRVQKEVDIRNAAMRRAGKLLTPEQLKEFIEETKAIDSTDKDAHKKFREALDKLRKDDPMTLVYELPSLRRAIRTSLDLSALFMQGAIYSLDPTNAATTARNIREMFKSFANDEYAKAVMYNAHADELGQEIDRYAPQLLPNFGADVDVTTREEAYATRVFDAIAEASYENLPYQAFNPAQALPAVVAASVGLPLMVTAGPLIGIPAALVASKATSLIVSKINPAGGGIIQSSITLDLTTGLLRKWSERMAKVFEYKDTEGNVTQTWDQKVSAELGAALPFVPKAAPGSTLKDRVQGSVASAIRQGARMLRASERGYVVPLTLQRRDAWARVSKQIKATGMNPDTHPEAFQSLGRIIGMLTGRADLGKFEDISVHLSKLFFSARFQWSRVQIVATTPVKIVASTLYDKYGTERGKEKYKSLAGGRAYVPASSRKEFVRALSHAFAGLGVILTLAALAGAEIFLDPRHKAFLKGRFKNITADFSGGLANWYRLLAQGIAREQLSTPENVHSPGTIHFPGDTAGMKRKDFGGTARGNEQSAREFLNQNIQGKENPLIGDLLMMHFGQDVFKNPVYRGRFDKKNAPAEFDNPEAWTGVMRDIWNNFGPLSPVDMINSVSEERETVELLVSLMAGLGVNIKANEFKKP